jgi:hypothetical protein
MKKIYMMPETLVLKIQTTSMIAASDPDVVINSEDEVEAGSVESRRYGSMWDDDDDEY